MSEWWFEAEEEEDYLEAERQLREIVRAEPDRWTVVADRLDDDDPITRLMASVVLGDAEAEDSQIAQVDAYLDSAARNAARTPAVVPSVPGVVRELAARFGTQLGELLALRLAKGTATPIWREAVALSYLTQHPTPAVTEALLRYAARTAEPRLQTAAAQAVVASRDPDLRRKVAAETSRLAASGQALPPAVTSVLA